jgi:hypothetical protein
MGCPLRILGASPLLAQVSQIICDIADIAELTINPLVAGPEGVMALDARVRIAGAGIPTAHRLAIRPYPKELEEEISLPDGQKLLLRPIRPEDEPALYALFSMLSPEEIRLRFLSPMKMLPRTLAARLTQIDYDREMALMLFGKNAAGAFYILDRKRVHPLDVPFTEALKAVSRWRSGAKDLVAAMETEGSASREQEQLERVVN